MTSYDYRSQEGIDALYRIADALDRLNENLEKYLEEGEEDDDDPDAYLIDDD